MTHLASHRRPTTVRHCTGRVDATLGPRRCPLQLPRGLYRALELTATDYRRPVLDPTTVFDRSGPLEDPLTDEVLQVVEAQLGHKLPTAYVDLARRHNGGSFARDAHPAPSPTSWAEEHIGVDILAAIGHTAPFSLCGELGSAFWVAEWGYPDIGIYIADCPSAGHDMIALDYRSPGSPTVVHVDQERDYQITALAPDFETFVTGLVYESTYEFDK